MLCHRLGNKMEKRNRSIFLNENENDEIYVKDNNGYIEKEKVAYVVNDKNVLRESVMVKTPYNNNNNNYNNISHNISLPYNIDAASNTIFNSNDSNKLKENSNKKNAYSSIIHRKSIQNNISNSLIHENELNENFQRKLKTTYLIFIILILIYLNYMLFIILVTIVIYEKNKDLPLSDKIDHFPNKEWFYQCKLDNLDFHLNLLYMVLIIFMLLEGKTISLYECIYSNIQYINYSVYLSFFLEPLVNVIKNTHNLFNYN
ncbi:hypothetical protein PIROE2DRAFT_9517 [Piromyces sp. E2]|nr:hypothetical protein PIROE2DRAFT_9517 [Piromyces sp. E2]|eukprot:OUM63848.1 hypothetical protein PIROE2DRAFT_9517 [Piromyces sp. E2]